MKTVMFALLGVLLVVGAAQATTLDDIKTNVKNNYNAVSNVVATSDVTYVEKETFTRLTNDTSSYDDAVWKQAGVLNFRIDGTGADTTSIIGNGSNNTLYHDLNGDDIYSYINQDGWLGHGGRNRAVFDFNAVINGNTWTLDASTYTVSGISCYKITSSNYDMYVDAATKTKTMKIVDKTSDLEEYILFTNWTLVENTAYLAANIDHYYGTSSSSTALTNLNINETLGSATWMP